MQTTYSNPFQAVKRVLYLDTSNPYLETAMATSAELDKWIVIDNWVPKSIQMTMFAVDHPTASNLPLPPATPTNTDFPLPNAIVPESNIEGDIISIDGEVSPLNETNSQAIITSNAPIIQTIFSYSQDGMAIPVSITSVSRDSHDNERYERCQQTGRIIRLTTGCIPITEDGRILLVSSKKKNEWGLPKGGWELDETMEESAIRESYEEAGIIGKLGERLDEVIYETRKAKRRRVPQGEKEIKSFADSNCSFYEGNSFTDSISEQSSFEFAFNQQSRQWSTLSQSSDITTEGFELDTPSLASSCCSSADGIIKEASNKAKREHHMCRMVLFPLYVTNILDKWPEGTRTRKSMDIDDALSSVSRPELVAALKEVKRKKLHLVHV